MQDKIKIISIGGAGTNILNKLMELNDFLEFYSISTSREELNQSNAPKNNKLLIGEQLLKGLGANANGELGKQAVQESKEELKKFFNDHIVGASITTLIAGLGGGTGTGATIEIAKILNDMEIFATAIVCTPFLFEGKKRRKVADDNIDELGDNVESLMVISNQKMLEDTEHKIDIIEAFIKSDKILSEIINGICSYANYTE